MVRGVTQTPISALNSHQVNSDQLLRYQNTAGVVFRFNTEGRIVDAETDGGC